MEKKSLVRTTLGLCAGVVRTGLCAGLCARVVRQGCAPGLCAGIVRSCALSAGRLCAGLCAGGCAQGLVRRVVRKDRAAQPAQGLCEFYFVDCFLSKIVIKQ